MKKLLLMFAVLALLAPLASAQVVPNQAADKLRVILEDGAPFLKLDTGTILNTIKFGKTEYTMRTHNCQYGAENPPSCGPVVPMAQACVDECKATCAGWLTKCRLHTVNFLNGECDFDCGWFFEPGP